ncbi:unnamed protein product, partial [Mesorhabditis belari]|uniref:Uncharacterized protein n=1 Tax=Mesorhabditis belari TaxID=2138241 RepID=A0AAF3JBM1_9BILA
MILRWLLLVFFALHTEAAPKCENVLRSDVKWYFDDRHRMCMAFRTDCQSRFQVVAQFFDSEEECTLNRMKTLWKNIRVRCPVDLRMATFKRTNGDRVPFLFSAEMCHSDGFSDMCDKTETCFTVEWLGFCCNDEAFLGDGPNAGVFNVTGLGGPVNHIRNAAHSEPPSEAPVNCNEDGDRNEVEWFRNPSGRGCVSQRIQCSLPKFTRPIRQDVFPDEQSCMDFWFPNEHILRTFDCAEEGFSAAVDINGTPLVYEKRLCGSPHDSDFCNRDEVCKTLSDVGFCCQRSSEGAFKYAQMGRKNRQQPIRVHRLRRVL